MSIRVECDLPYAGESFPLSDLVAFVEQAEAAGADPDTPVVAVTAPQDDTLVIALRIEQNEPLPSGGRPTPDRSAGVRLDRSDVVEAVAVLEAIEDNDGDARMQLAAVRALRQRLTKLAIA